MVAVFGSHLLSEHLSPARAHQSFRKEQEQVALVLRISELGLVKEKPLLLHQQGWPIPAEIFGIRHAPSCKA